MTRRVPPNNRRRHAGGPWHVIWRDHYPHMTVGPCDPKHCKKHILKTRTTRSLRDHSAHTDWAVLSFPSLDLAVAEAVLYVEWARVGKTEVPTVRLPSSVKGPARQEALSVIKRELDAMEARLTLKVLGREIGATA